MLARDLQVGDRITHPEYGTGTVELVYPGSPTGVWGATHVMYRPDGYAASRTVTYPIGGHATLAGDL